MTARVPAAGERMGRMPRIKHARLLGVCAREGEAELVPGLASWGAGALQPLDPGVRPEAHEGRVPLVPTSDLLVDYVLRSLYDGPV